MTDPEKEEKVPNINHTHQPDFNYPFPGRMEQEGGGLSGDLRSFLREEYLSPYLTYMSGFDEDAHHEELLPQAIETILHPIVSETDVQVTLFGSAARSIAAGMNPRFWVTKTGLETERIRHLDDPGPVGDFFRHPLAYSLATDLDLTVDGISVENLFNLMQSTFRIDNDRIRELDFSVNGRTFIRREGEFQLTGYRISVSAGPIPSVPWIRNMVIAIHDGKSGEQLFHFDISETPRSGTLIEREKRQGGKTTSWQDNCVATLIPDNRHILYYMTPQARDVLSKPDRVTTETRDPGDLLELVLRAVRMQGLHELRSESVPATGEVIALPRFDMLLPELSSDKTSNVFTIRQRIFEAVRKDGAITNPNTEYLAKKELALCLIIDPYLTIQALRDTGISLLIPGLRRISRNQWDQLLQSRHLVVRGLATSPEMRSFSFMADERRAYSDSMLVDGLERFISALQEVSSQSGWVSNADNPWLSYLKLWEQPEGKSEHMGVLDSYEDPANPERQRAERTIRMNAQGTELGYEIRQVDELESGRRRLINGERNRVTSVEERIVNATMLYLLIRQFPTGLTPREMEGLFDRMNMNVPRNPDFGAVLLDLKLTGLLNRYDLTRFHHAGHIEGVAFYDTDVSEYKTNLRTLLTNHEFLRFLDTYFSGQGIENSGYSIEEYGLSAMVQDWIREFINTFDIPTVEALRTLTRKDMERLINRLDPDYVRPTPDLLMGKAQYFMRIYTEYKTA